MKVKAVPDRDKVIDALKKIKADLAPHGIGVAAHLSIEAGPASGYVTVSYSFPSAVKWAELVDSNKDTLQRLRQEAVAHSGDIVGTSLLQEIPATRAEGRVLWRIRLPGAPAAPASIRNQVH
jgi:hypothetical protein